MAKEIVSGLGSKKRTQSQKAAVNDHEREIAETLGGVRQPGSGAFGGKKNDVRLDRFLLDSKETIHGEIKVGGAELAKVCHHAAESQLYPGLVLTLKGKLAATTPSEWVAIPLSVFAEMVQLGQDSHLDPAEGLPVHDESG